MNTVHSERQIELMEAAGRILTVSGVSGLTTKNLAAEMNFSESAIYRHFDSKEAIIVALLEYMATKMEERYASACQEGMSGKEQFVCFFEKQCSFFSKNPHLVVAVFSDGLMEQSQAINKGILNIMALKRNHLIPILSAGQKAGDIDASMTAEALANIIMGAFRLQMLQWKLKDFSYDIEEKGRSLTNSLLKLIKPKSS